MSFIQLADDSPAKKSGGGLAKAQECDGSLAKAQKSSMADDSMADNSPSLAQKCAGLQHNAGQASINIEAFVPSLRDDEYGLPLLTSKRSTF